MNPIDVVGRTGRALTEIGGTGRVEVDGHEYEAAARSPIVAGEAIEVTGWRAVGDLGYVLSVRRPGETFAPVTIDGARPAPREPASSPPPRAGAAGGSHAWARLAAVGTAELTFLVHALCWIGALAALVVGALVLCPPKVVEVPANAPHVGVSGARTLVRLGHSTGGGTDLPPDRFWYRESAVAGPPAEVATDWPLLTAELALVVAVAGLATASAVAKCAATALRTIGRETD